MEESPPLEWSASFSVLSSSSKTSKSLQGDRIILPQSALEQLLAAAPSSRHPSGPSSFTVYDPTNPYASPLRHETSSQELPNPLTFRLVNPSNDNVVYAGIREFSAPEGTVALSPFLMEALDIRAGQTIEWEGTRPEDPMDLTEDAPSKNESIQIAVHAKQLPKGTFVRLRPLEAGYNPDDWKSLLERQLRQSFTTLTKDSVLSVTGVKGDSFQLLVDKFLPEGDGICVVDTDLEVDIEALNEEQARETLQKIMAKAQPGSAHGSSKGGELDIWKDVEGQVVPGEYVDYTLPSWNRSQELEIGLTNLAGDDEIDLFVTPKSAQQRSLPRDSVHVFGAQSPARDGSKAILITPTNVELEGAETLMISIYGYRHSSDPEATTPRRYTLRAKAVAPGGTSADPIQIAEEEEHSPDDEQCKNCFQWVPKRTIMLHENFCRRNNTVCPTCKSVFQKGSEEHKAHWHCEKDDAHGNMPSSRTKHDDIFHTERACPSCEFVTNSLPDLARHQTSICPGKIILCRFCHLEVPQEGDPFNPSPEVMLSGMTAHELADGARTTECHLCDKIIRLRDMELHMKHHELDKGHRSKPPICRNGNCGRTLHGVGPRGQVGSGTAQGQGPGNDLGLCSLCYGPLYVSMYDPDGKALRRRIERRYLSQLMTGCAKPHCRNEWCKTGRAAQGLEAKGSSASAALPLVKPLLEEIPHKEKAMWFCADESSQKRRKVADMLAAEGLWDVEWCVAAAEAEKGDASKMREWLQAWAPRKT